MKRVKFLDFISKYLEKNRWQYSIETIKTYKSHISKLNRFSDKIYVKDIDEDFIFNYKKHCVVMLRNNENTAVRSVAILKTFHRLARKNSLTNTNPFEFVRLKKVDGHKTFLVKSELDSLVELFSELENYTLKNVLRYFLFACYTGLRFTDVRLLKYRDLNNNIIDIVQHKTKRRVRIPIMKMARKLILDSENKTGFIFNVLSNQKTNFHLKRIANLVDINKRLTFHVSRHTFATTGITIGIPIEVISKLLGHTKIATTQVYAQIIDDVTKKYMLKFDEM